MFYPPKRQEILPQFKIQLKAWIELVLNFMESTSHAVTGNSSIEIKKNQGHVIFRVSFLRNLKVFIKGEGWKDVLEKHSVFLT